MPSIKKLAANVSESIAALTEFFMDNADATNATQDNLDALIILERPSTKNCLSTPPSHIPSTKPAPATSSDPPSLWTSSQPTSTSPAPEPYSDYDAAQPITKRSKIPRKMSRVYMDGSLSISIP